MHLQLLSLLIYHYQHAIFQALLLIMAYSKPLSFVVILEGMLEHQNQHRNVCFLEILIDILYLYRFYWLVLITNISKKRFIRRQRSTINFWMIFRG